jgi:hypothetical protein
MVKFDTNRGVEEYDQHQKVYKWKRWKNEIVVVEELLFCYSTNDKSPQSHGKMAGDRARGVFIPDPIDSLLFAHYFFAQVCLLFKRAPSGKSLSHPN